MRSAYGAGHRASHPTARLREAALVDGGPRECAQPDLLGRGTTRARARPRETARVRPKLFSASKNLRILRKPPETLEPAPEPTLEPRKADLDADCCDNP
jgi:hypothetical protein